MTRNAIIKKLKNYFDVTELVCPHAYKKFGEYAWQVIKTEQLHALLIVREDILKCPMYINDWHTGGIFSQRGTRCNACKLVVNKKGKPYLSAHTYGGGDDFTCSDYTAEESRKLIKENADLFPFPIRLEYGKSWVHMDTNDYEYNLYGDWVYEFKV